jgi:hypothetical protein
MMCSQTFTNSIEGYSKYPQNLYCQNVHPHRLRVYFEDLNSRENKLFNEDCPAVDVLDYSDMNCGKRPDYPAATNIA